MYSRLALVLLLFQLSSVKSDLFAFKTNNNFSFTGRVLRKHVVEEFSTKSQVTQCAMQCFRTHYCKSFNYEQSQKLCQLNNATHVDYPQDFHQDKLEVEYHLKEAFSIHDEAIGPCGSHPCQNGGRCLDTKSALGKRMYICVACNEGWTGRNCHTKEKTLEWSSWNTWGMCSTSCGYGFRSRKRHCENVETQNRISSDECFGRDEQYSNCEYKKCPKWDEWSDWGECSTYTTCGRGYKLRHRNCSNGGVAGVDRYCKGPTTESAVCDGISCKGVVRLRTGKEYGEGIVSLHDDLNDDWMEVCGEHWNISMANIACKQSGFLGAHEVIVEEKSVDNTETPPSYNLNCSGNESTLQTCSRTISDSCSVNAGVKCRVRGVWSLWSSWGECSVTCENGTRIRLRECNHPPPNNNGIPCPGKHEDFKKCSLPMCPIDGIWKSWSTWSECSVTCENGTKERSRECHGPFYGGKECGGPKYDSAPCFPKMCPVDGVWNTWTEWSKCTVTCGYGTKHRNRTCHGPFYEGADCPGNKDDTESCNTFSCPVDGSWKPWMEWEQCSVTCGGGNKNRTRKCNLPEHGGEHCEGPSLQTIECNSHYCPVDGVWNTWSTWTKCTVTCGYGTKFRNRECHGPFYGGSDCDGNMNETESCNTFSCPVDGSWKLWVVWGDCTVSCGGGSRNRSRECNLPEHGGQTCHGPSVDVEDCNTDECPIDGMWKLWSPWDECSVTCGGGSRNRSRICIDPKHGGQSCPGPSMQTTNCNDFECPIDGVWTLWSVWDECNVTCGGGGQGRYRDCEGPFYGGDNCTGLEEEARDCNTHYCPVDGVWEVWSNWTECSLTCGGGVQTRNRTCDGPYYGGQNCTGDADAIRDCNTHHCPVDGYFEPWSEWEKCSQTCGKGGTKWRNRKCEPPKYGGADCVGNYDESADCSLYHCPVNCIWLNWSTWSKCTLTCGNGTQERVRDKTGPFYNGDNCTGSPTAIRDCNVFECPVDGFWTKWSNWFACSHSCGRGSQLRNRTCIGPFYGGKDCSGDHNETTYCNPFNCPVSGEWLTWGGWEPCNVTCGGGIQLRNRQCDGPYHGGEDCVGKGFDSQICEDFPCPIDGIWEEWTPWEICSKTCGNGTQLRDRNCYGPFHGGNNCTGPEQEIQDCNTFNCPIDGIFSIWSKWFDCSITCGGGIQWRNRSCIGPYFDGAECVGDFSDSQSCNKHPCPIDGIWKPWTPWQQCNVTCGGGMHQRDRECEGPFHGGANCSGAYTEEKECNTHPCPIDGKFTDWTDWEECNATCGGGIQWRNRTCIGPFHKGLPCHGDFSSSRSCNEQECPIDGVWITWSAWDTCNVTCGGGIHWRFRDCEGPFYGGSNCSGPYDESKTCSDHHCPVDGYWEEWMPWQQCNVTCGGGMQLRQRTCVEPKYGGEDCIGSAFDQQDCNIFHCPVDGVFMPWSTWTECNVTCGGGIQWRDRTCDGPYYNGTECIGEYTDDRDCNTHNCPIDGIWKPWSDWDDCPVTCGGAIINRTRECIGPFYNGAPCEGNSTEQMDCGTDPCPIPGEWLDWESWSRCSVSCDGGERSRSRVCNMTSYGDLTIPCLGSNVSVEDCHTFGCVPHARQCSELVQWGLLDSVHATIDPDGQGGIEPVDVFCDVDDEDGIGVTIMGHDNVNRTSIFGFEGGKMIILKYNIAEGIITYIIDRSLACKQFLLWECKGAVIHNPFQPDTWTTFWTDRSSNDNVDAGSQYKPAGYFPGATPGSGKCACGMTNSCYDPLKPCNCDANDKSIWLADGGNLTHKEDLPIIAFFAGDTGDEAVENGLFTIGPVKCWGEDSTNIE